MLHSTLPESILDEVKIRMLREYEEAYIRFRELDESENDIADVVTEIFIAILHPSATRLECIKCSNHPKIMDGFKMRYFDLVYSAIQKMKNVRAIGICNASYFNIKFELRDYYFYKINGNIEEFHCNTGTNFEIETLSKLCKNLKILNVGDSLDVYEESVPYILKMECLEELDVHYTSISTEGFNDLLSGLVSTKHSDNKFASECLKKFVCNGLSEEQVFLISDKFPNLTSLSLLSLECDLAPLKVLKHLKCLYVNSPTYKFLKELFSSIGGQFVCLNLGRINDIDLKHIASTCTAVSCLHLRSCPYIDSNITEKHLRELVSVPEFPQITNLELSFDNESGMFIQHMLSGFRNVRCLLLSNCSNNKVFDYLRERKYLKHLEIAFFKKYRKLNIALQFFEKYVVITDFPEVYSESKISVYSCPI